MNSLVEYARSVGVMELSFRPNWQAGPGDPSYRPPAELAEQLLARKKSLERLNLDEFRSEISAFRIFPPKPNDKIKRHFNGWTALSTDYWLSGTVNVDLVHSDDERDGAAPHLTHVFTLAHSDMDGLIGVDLHPDRFGWIGYYWYQASMTEGGYPVVAHSFREWLERTVNAGPDVRYWEQDDFKDLGPAIPGDPFYRGPNDH